MAIGIRSRYSIFNPTDTYYTKGFEYSLDGENYVGEYHIKDGIPYKGPVTDVERIELTRFYSEQNNFEYDKLFDFKKVEPTFKKIQAAKIEPQETDYELGFYERYFLYNITDATKMPIEIQPAEQEILGKTKGYDDRVNDLVVVKWQLTGPLNNTTSRSGLFYAGIYETNVATVEKISQKYPNMLYAFRNYTEFARPNFS